MSSRLWTVVSRTTLTSKTRPEANGHTAVVARRFVRDVLAERAVRADSPAHPDTERLVDDAAMLVGELVTDVVNRDAADVEIACLLEARQGPVQSRQGTAVTGPTAPAAAPTAPAGEPKPAGVVIEVTYRDPSAEVPEPERNGEKDARHGGFPRSLRLAGTVAESWGVTCRSTRTTLWFRLEMPEIETNAVPDNAAPDDEPREMRAAKDLAPALSRPGRDATGLSFLAEAGELLAGQLDENMVAALAGQLLVPRLADWCGVWLNTDPIRMRLSRVWHVDERRIGAFRVALEKAPPQPGLDPRAVPWPWPESADATAGGGSALAIPLVAGSRCQGVLLLGRAGVSRMTDDAVRLSEAVARRVAQAVATAHEYTRQVSISRALQRRQLPAALAEIPGIDTAIVYEPSGEGQTVGGDFYDLFPARDGRWCFLLGDVCGSDPEAMSVAGLARHLVRLLAREGHGVASVLNRLNLALMDDSIFAGRSASPVQPRFLSLLYGDLKPDPNVGGAYCTIASAGHPLPLRLSADGAVAPATDPQLLLGIDEKVEFHADSFELAPGETLLCVTDGVTERRSGDRQLDDDGGLADVLRGCIGLGAKAVAERVRSAAHDFGPAPVDDDLAVLVLEAVAQS